MTIFPRFSPTEGLAEPSVIIGGSVEKKGGGSGTATKAYAVNDTDKKNNLCLDPVEEARL